MTPHPAPEISPAAADLLDPLLGPEHKGYPPAAPPLRRSAIGAQGWSVVAGDLPLPLAVIRQPALRHNLGWQQRFARERGLELAPHGKTTMSPQLFAQQLDAGAWGLTVANVQQLRIALGSGAQRVLIANQVLARPDLAAIARPLAERPGRRVLFLLDSLAQLASIESAAAAGAAPAGGFEVLLEIGVPGGRTGCRDHDGALALARAAHASAAVRLAGLECYEGLGARGEDAADTAYAQALMQRLHAVALQCDAEGLFAPGAVILSAGGSGLFDLVAPGLRLALSRPVTGLLRSGCYVTHDQGAYTRLLAAVERRTGCGSSLRAALEVWAWVQSVPEPGLAILGAGRRDISFDMGLPMPIAWWPAGATAAQPPGSDWQVTGLNDQHAHLRGTLATERGPLRVGDRLVLGLSHPCTTFDKWRWMPVVDDDYRVVDAISTCF